MFPEIRETGERIVNESRFISLYMEITECNENVARSVYIFMSEKTVHPVEISRRAGKQSAKTNPPASVAHNNRAPNPAERDPKRTRST